MTTLFRGAVAVAALLLVVTPHDAFGEFDVGELTARMRDIPVVVDVPGILDGDAASDAYIYRRL